MANYNKNKKRDLKKYSLAEKRSYWVGYGMGLENPSGKASSYATSLSSKEKISFKNGISKARNIPVADMNYFQKKKSQ